LNVPKLASAAILAGGLLVGAWSGALASSSDGHQDKVDIIADAHEIHSDIQDIRDDREDGNIAELHADLQDLRQDRHDLHRDIHDLRRDRDR
jgi:hypothetical protein